jgi:hypothetical protein
MLEGGNRYAYTDGNPVNRIDPNGENWRHELANGLQGGYDWWQANFVESGWSQAIRANDNKAMAVAAGAIIIAGTLATGGALGVVAAAVVTAAGAGAAIGGTMGVGYGLAMYELAMSGKCGCDAIAGVKAFGSREDFVAYAGMSGVVNGAFYGGLAGTGPLGQIASGLLGVGEGAIGIGGAISNAHEYGGDVCDLINGLLGVAGILGGVAGIKQGINGLKPSGNPPPRNPKVIRDFDGYTEVNGRRMGYWDDPEAGYITLEDGTIRPRIGSGGGKMSYTVQDGTDAEGIYIDPDLTAAEVQAARDEIARISQLENARTDSLDTVGEIDFSDIYGSQSLWHRIKILGQNWRAIIHIDNESRTLYIAAILKRTDNTYQIAQRLWWRWIKAGG